MLAKEQIQRSLLFFSSLFHSVPCNSVRIVRPYEVKSMCIVGEFIFYMGMETFFSTCLWNSYHLYFIARMKTQCVFFFIHSAHFISHSDTEAFCSFPSFSVYTVHIHHTSVNIWTNFFCWKLFFHRVLSGIAWKTYEMPLVRLLFLFFFLLLYMYFATNER